jgi:hypothetical protein
VMCFFFQRLEEGLLKPHTAGAADDNYYRNRFNSILPCKYQEICSAVSFIVFLYLKQTDLCDILCEVVGPES